MRDRPRASDREGSRNQVASLQIADSTINVYPGEVLLKEYVSRRLEFGRAIECADIEMRFGRQPRAFTCQGRSA